MIRYFFIIILFYSSDVYPELNINEELRNVPGGILATEITESEHAMTWSFNKKNVLSVKNNNRYYLLYGLKHSHLDGNHDITFTSGKFSKNISYYVKKKKFLKQFINISKKYIAPSNDELKRIRSEGKLFAPYRTKKVNKQPDIDFIYPVNGIITGQFGTRRFYNGVEGRMHNGLDIASKDSLDIIAPSSGTVIFVGDFFYNGKFAYIGHGKGLKSIFLHMSEVSVKIGQRVKKGQIIGKIGNTGKSAGAHLHWSLILNDTYIDPMVFLKNDL